MKFATFSIVCFALGAIAAPYIKQPLGCPQPTMPVPLTTPFHRALAAVPDRGHPLPYAATIRDCLPSGRQCSATRYYIPKGQQ